jgi:hypothetical protein
MAVNETAFYKLLEKQTDRDKIFSLIGTELLLGIESGFDVMLYHGYEKNQINAAAVYDVADKILNNKTKSYTK